MEGSQAPRKLAPMYVPAAPDVPPALRWIALGLARCSLGTALLLGGCADETPPRFAGELSLALTDDQLEATWPAASDDVRVEAYLVHVDGAAVARLDRDTLGYTLEGVRERTTRTLRVTAVDASGNESAPLEAGLSVPDRTPPLFPADARMTVTGDSEAVTLSWPPATDEGAVHYVVSSGDHEIGTVTVPTFTLSRAAVDAAWEAETTVLAIDDADNRSSTLASRWEQFFSSPREREEMMLLIGALGPGMNDALLDVLAGGSAYGSAEDLLAEDTALGVATAVSESPFAPPTYDSNAALGGIDHAGGGRLGDSSTGVLAPASGD
jgi:hypothetical protein